MVLKVITRRSYPYRSFYIGDKRIAFYALNPIGEEPSVIIYRNDKPILYLKRSEVCDNQYTIERSISKYFKKEVVDAMMKYLIKDLGCIGSFSPMSYINWRKSQGGNH
jgi:hypothetical protein